MKKTLPLVFYPDARLRQTCQEVKTVDDNIRQLIAAMANTMQANDGIGLAAPQVGRSERVIVVNTKDGVLPLINPLTTKHSLRKETDEEGCLSIPKFFGPVKRYKSITVTFLDQNGEPVTLQADGLFARVIQHEIDHINGVLFIDYLKQKDLSDDIRQKMKQEKK